MNNSSLGATEEIREIPLGQSVFFRVGDQVVRAVLTANGLQLVGERALVITPLSSAFIVIK